MAVRSEKAWRRRWKPDLRCQNWQPFRIEYGDYQVKAHFVESDCSYEFCISDLGRIWYEKVDETAFNSRAQALNPNVEAKASYLLRHVQRNVEKQQEDTSYSVQKAPSESGETTLVLRLKSKLQAGVPFVWECHCSQGSHEMLRMHLLEPTLAMVSELSRQQDELCVLLKKKDLEIREYKHLGVKISRKSLETPEFDETAFTNKMVLSQGFEDAVKMAAVEAFSGTLGDLYKNVMIKSSWLREKDLPPGEDDDGFGEVLETVPVVDNAPSVSSWTERLPPSLLNKDAPPTATSPKKTPVPSPATSPSKDLELKRREELQKKLAEDAEKKKRKKRKINL